MEETISATSRISESASISDSTNAVDEPSQKKSKIEEDCFTKTKKDRLETRLVSVLSCVVCFDLSNGPIYQCIHGHLMCVGCFNHLLADGRLKNEQASCPSCRAELSSKNASRNLAVEKAVSELPSHCHFCMEELPRNKIPYHENYICDQRPAFCEYESLGCRWEGMHHQKEAHHSSCGFPSKTGFELLEAVKEKAAEAMEEIRHMKTLFKMLSYEKIAYCDVQLCSSRTDDYIPKLFYETNRFDAFDQLWVIKAKVLGNEKSANRGFAYQLIFKGKGTYEIKYFLVKGSFGDAKIIPEVQRFEFRDDKKESEFHTLLLEGDGECNRLLAARTINVRLMMFLVKK